MTTQWSQKAGKIYQLLDRERLSIELPLFLEDETILITGADGFIGQVLSKRAEEAGAIVHRSDIGDADVRDYHALQAKFIGTKPTLVIHLAAHKYATSAEEIPAEVADLNIRGTRNVGVMCEHFNAKLVLASTCKAADPCTAYGASKLIAERVVLNYEEGRVFRLVNVLGSTGSVIDIWDKIPLKEPLPVTRCLRYWISPDEAADYLLATSAQALGVYAPYLREGPIPVHKIATKYAPGRSQLVTDMRRGDRPIERLIGGYERFEKYVQPNMMKIQEPWPR